MFSTWRSPTTMSALPSRIGWISLGMSSAQYWLSASVFTTMSAPSFRHASRPAWKPAARPLLLVRRTTWSTPFSRATSIVRSVDPSSTMSHSSTSIPGSSRGSSASVAGSCCSSLKQGIWMMSFIWASDGGAAAKTGAPRGRSRARTLAAVAAFDLQFRRQRGLQDLAHVALADGVGLAQHPDLREPLVAAAVEHFAHVAAAHRCRLAEHPRLDRILGLRGGGTAHEGRAAQHHPRDPVGAAHLVRARHLPLYRCAADGTASPPHRPVRERRRARRLRRRPVEEGRHRADPQRRDAVRGVLERARVRPAVAERARERVRRL